MKAGRNPPAAGKTAARFLQQNFRTGVSALKRYARLLQTIRLPDRAGVETGQDHPTLFHEGRRTGRAAAGLFAKRSVFRPGKGDLRRGRGGRNRRGDVPDGSGKRNAF